MERDHSTLPLSCDEVERLKGSADLAPWMRARIAAHLEHCRRPRHGSPSRRVFVEMERDDVVREMIALDNRDVPGARRFRVERGRLIGALEVDVDTFVDVEGAAVELRSVVRADLPAIVVLGVIVREGDLLTCRIDVPVSGVDDGWLALFAQVSPLPVRRDGAPSLVDLVDVLARPGFDRGAGSFGLQLRGEPLLRRFGRGLRALLGVDTLTAVAPTPAEAGVGAAAAETLDQAIATRGVALADGARLGRRLSVAEPARVVIYDLGERADGVRVRARTPIDLAASGAIDLDVVAEPPVGFHLLVFVVGSAITVEAALAELAEKWSPSLVALDDILAGIDALTERAEVYGWPYRVM